MGPTHRVDADSDSREYIPTADSPFYRFPNLSRTPVPLVVSPVFPRCTGVCVFVPRGILRASWPSGWSRVRSAASIVLRGFVVLIPLFAQGQHYAVYLFFTTGGGGSVSLITCLHRTLRESSRERRVGDGAGGSSSEAGRAHVGDGGDMAHFCLACSGEPAIEAARSCSTLHDRAEHARHETALTGRETGSDCRACF